MGPFLQGNAGLRCSWRATPRCSARVCAVEGVLGCTVFRRRRRRRHSTLAVCCATVSFQPSTGVPVVFRLLIR